MSASPPALGAAVTLDCLPRLRNWLFDAERDVEIQDFFEPEALLGDWRPKAARIRELLDGHRGRIGLHGPFIGFTLDAADPEVAAIVARRLDLGLELCAATGADQMVIHSPFTIWDHCNLDSRPGAREALIERVRANTARAVARAEDQGVTLVIENIEDCDPGERRRLAEALGSPRVKLSVDTGHALFARGVAGAPPVDYFIRSAGEMLEHVHLQDADGHADRHWPPGQGAMLWPAVFAAIAALPQRPRLIIEIDDFDRIVEAAEHLAGLGLAR